MANALPSKKQQALLDYIDAFIRENNYAPSYREVMRALDYKSVSTVASHVAGLIERGWLIKRDNSARSLEVIYKTEQSMTLAQSPAPSLPDPHALLKQIIDTKLADKETPVTYEQHVALISTLKWLDLHDLAAQYQAGEENT